MLAARFEAAKHLIDWIIEERPDAWEPLLIRAEGALIEERFDDAAADLTEIAALATRDQYEPALQERASRLANFAGRSRPGPGVVEGLAPDSDLGNDPRRLSRQRVRPDAAEIHARANGRLGAGGRLARSARPGNARRALAKVPARTGTAETRTRR